MRAGLPVVLQLVALLLTCSATRAVAASLQLEANVYVLKHSDFQSINLVGSKQASVSDRVVARSPTTLQFDREELSLAGDGFSWSGGRNPPERFTLIKIPATITRPGKPVELVSRAPVQFIEKKADGTLQVREISKDSADAPHCRITFTVMSPVEASGDLRVSCDLDMATVSGRENVPGVSLNVGRPLLARFQERVELTVRPGEWAALLSRTPNTNDHSLLLLLKITPERSSHKWAKTDQLMTTQEFAEFATYYYRDPQPDQIARAIESLGPNKLLDTGDMYSHLYHQTAYTCVGFFAEVLTANPDKVAEWRKLVERRGQDGDTRYWLRKALELQGRETLLTFGEKPSKLSRIEESNVLWGAFIASGNPAYLRKLIDRLEFVDEADVSLFDAGGQAMVLLAYNAPHHPQVRQTLDAARKEASPRSRELIDGLLNKELTAVLRELREMDHHPPHSDSPAHGRNYLPWRRPLPATPAPLSRGPK